MILLVAIIIMTMKVYEGDNAKELAFHLLYHEYVEHKKGHLELRIVAQHLTPYGYSTIKGVTVKRFQYLSGTYEVPVFFAYRDFQLPQQIPLPDVSELRELAFVLS